jgi:hypothetical protein
MPKSKRPTKLDQLLVQGEWVAVQIDGHTAPRRFVMPTPELQDELNKELEKRIRQHLKDGGFERICATRREHPFHSDLLRKRIDDLTDMLFHFDTQHPFDKAYLTEEGAEAARLNLYEFAEEMKNSRLPFTKHDADETVKKGVKDARRGWAAAFEKYRNMLRDLNWWKGTYLHRAIFPNDGPPLPDGPPPKPVYISKQSELVLSFNHGSVDLWVRV